MFWNYLSYLFKSHNSFRLHSPLVFALYNKVWHDLPKKDYQDELLSRLEVFMTEHQSVFKEGDYVMIFEDHHEDKHKMNVWNDLKNNEKVRISVDFYRFGLLFVMDRKEKEDFMLR